MNPYAVGPLFAVVALVQSTVTSHVRILGASPDLVLLLAVACVLRCGVRASLPVILAGGLMVDILSSAPFGCATAALLLVSTLVGIGEVNVPRSARTLPYIAAAVSTLVYQLFWMLLLAIAGRTLLWGPMFARQVLPSLLVNVLFMPLVLALARTLCHRTSDEPMV